ncbi:MAG: hypothetical protein WAN14_16480 [Candidatus Acidiferrales bacterium]
MARDLSIRSQYRHMPSQSKVVPTAPTIPKTSHEILPAADILLGSTHPKNIGVTAINPTEQTKNNLAARAVMSQSSLNIFVSPACQIFSGCKKLTFHKAPDPRVL